MLTVEQIERAATRLAKIDLPRRDWRRRVAWEDLQEYEREHYRWAVTTTVDLAFTGNDAGNRRLGIKHGYAPKGSETPEYRCWVSIKSRCFNSNNDVYAEYGGRGITMCEKWRNSFPAFLADVGLRPSAKHSIDRYPNNDGNYEPGNVRWASKHQQTANRRTTRWVNHNGKSIPLADACRLLDLNPNAVWMRISRGATPESAIASTMRSYERRGLSCG